MSWISNLLDRIKRFLNGNSSNMKPLDIGDDTIFNFSVYQNGNDSNPMDYYVLKHTMKIGRIRYLNHF